MNSKSIKDLEIYINNLLKLLKSYQNQLDFALNSSESSKEEIESIQDSIKTISKDLDIAKFEYSFLIDNSIVHDVDDIRKLFFGLFGNSVKAQKDWVDFKNEFKSDDLMFNHITNNYNRLSKKDIKSYLKKIFLG